MADPWLRGYLRLVRLPNVLTAWTDVAAGWLLAAATFGGTPAWKLIPLLVSSTGLYLAGMALNDVVDREGDARERPGRPIPSGAVSLRGAVLCGAALLLCGVGAGAVAGAASLCLAVALALAILLYDFAAKPGALGGPLTLGACRYLNLQLGLSAAPFFAAHWTEPASWRLVHAPALALGCYIAGVTAFSAQEERGAEARALLRGWAGVLAGLALAARTAVTRWAGLPLGLLAAVLAWHTSALVRGGTPAHARALVRSGVLGVCVFDAALVLGGAGTSAWPYVLALALAPLPALLLSRWLAQREA